LDFENHAKEEYSGAPALSISQRWHTPTLHWQLHGLHMNTEPFIIVEVQIG
jgi:hypothetical protein